MNELKSCPFCGSENVYPHQGFIMNCFLIHCLNCGALTTFIYKEERENVIEAYNKRAEVDTGKGIGEVFAKKEYLERRKK